MGLLRFPSEMSRRTISDIFLRIIFPPAESHRTSVLISHSVLGTCLPAKVNQTSLQ